MSTEKAGEANRLYWETDRAVAEIAESLDLSRRALYDAVEPIPSGTTCVKCGTMTHYPNRSARDSEQATCFACATGSPQEPESEEAEAWTWSPAAHEDAPVNADAAAALRERALRLGGVALVGALIGAVATHLLLGRD